MQNFFSQTFLISALSVFLFAQCAKSDSSGTTASTSTSTNTSSLKSTPTANAAYDSTAKGIYTGTITGSTGSWSIDYDNGGTGALPVFSYNYTPTGGSKVTGTITGTATTGASHTLDFSSTVSGVPFVVQIIVNNSTGAITSATLTVNSVVINIQVYKEKSTDLVIAYEGTSSGNVLSVVYGVAVPVTGAFNAVATPTTFQSVSRTLTSNGTACTSNCVGIATAITLNAVTKVASGSTAPATCGLTGTTGTCLCQTNFASTQGITATTTTISGTWDSAIAAGSSCTVNGTARAVGFVYASGTWSGTRTR